MHHIKTWKNGASSREENRFMYCCTTGGGCSRQGGASTSRVHSTIFGYIKSTVQILHIHERIKFFSLSW